MKIVLSQSQFELVSLITNGAINAKNIEYHISLNKIEIENILEFLSQKLGKDGFDENFEPNEVGILIESIIDQLTRKT